MYKDAQPRSGRNQRLDNKLTPRQDDFSSSSDMRDLKNALGGLSDRSGNNLLFNQSAGVLENDEIIFSDEGSNDSFNQEGNDEQDDEEVW